ncbi:MAG TPA: metalloregulator ArsR/SmtB family transcription factor [Candidatus Acidoferrales bacterium]|nr:metalloregulator ArsR/SmtB family transcription factor [Candidatus Acidoferrales bacterium]
MPQQLANFKAEFFKALAHPIRIRILDCLRDGEKGVNELSEMLRIEPANVSQQLTILRVRNIVVGRKSGSNVYYSVFDSNLFKLLDVAKDIFNNHLLGVRDMLQQIGAAS